MFFQNPETKLPDEVILNILCRLPLKDAISIMQASKELYNLTKDDRIWKKFGATNFEDFIERVHKLTDSLWPLILNETFNLSVAEKVHRIANLPTCEQALQELIAANLISNEQLATFPEHYRVLLSDINGAIALFEGLLTPERLVLFPDGYLEELLCDNGNGLQALREKLITCEQIATLPSARHLSVLLSNGGMLALREKLISLEQIANVSKSSTLSLLFYPHGLKALRAGSVTLEQVAKIQDYEEARQFILKSINETDPRPRRFK